MSYNYNFILFLIFLVVTLSSQFIGVVQSQNTPIPCTYISGDNHSDPIECYYENGIAVQYCQSNQQYGPCEFIDCQSGYVFDHGITKKCISTFSLTLYDVVLLSAFGVIVIALLLFVSKCYKSKSLDQDKYHSMSSNKSVEMAEVGGANGEMEEVYQEYDESLLEILSLGENEIYLVALGIALSLVDIGLGLVVPLVAANIYNYLYSGEVDKINGTILTFALIIIGMIIVQFMCGIVLALAGHRIIRRLRNRLFSAILQQDMAFFNERKTGELMSRLATDVSSVRSIISDSVPHIIIQFGNIFGGLIMLLIISWKLTLVVLSPLPVLLVFSNFYGAYIEKISLRVQDALADAASHAAETLFNMRTVRWFSSEQLEMKKFKDLINISYKIALRMTIWNGIYTSTSGIFEQLSVFILLWYGANLVKNGELSPSMLIAFNLFLPFISGAVTNLSSLYTTYKSYRGASVRFFEIMQRKPDIPFSGGLTVDRRNLTGEIQFNRVTFAYDGRDPVLRELSIQFKPNTITALIGTSGGGKSTILSLIGHLYKINGGTISLDGHDISTMNIQNLHSHISIVNQEPSLFTGTIAENVAYGAPNVTREQIMQACQQANAHGFITQLPDGYDTLIGERGAALSGGQKQRIAIARTIIRNPLVLLLDEATSELDVESERLVQEAIESLVVNRTVIIVAHRLSTILTADVIAVVSDGDVKEIGTPEQLVEARGMFYDFVQIQYGQGDGGEVKLNIPPKSRNLNKLRMRSETIKQAIASNKTDRMPASKDIVERFLDNDDEIPSGSGVPTTTTTTTTTNNSVNVQPTWRSVKSKSKKWTQHNSTSFQNNENPAPVQGQWRRGAVDEKLNRVIAKSRRKGFFNEAKRDLKSSLVNY